MSPLLEINLYGGNFMNSWQRRVRSEQNVAVHVPRNYSVPPHDAPNSKKVFHIAAHTVSFG